MELATAKPPVVAASRKRPLDAVDSHSSPVRSKKPTQRPTDVPAVLINDVPSYVNGTVSARVPLSSFKAKETIGVTSAATPSQLSSVSLSTVAGDDEEGACSSSSSSSTSTGNAVSLVDKSQAVNLLIHN